MRGGERGDELAVMRDPRGVRRKTRLFGERQPQHRAQPGELSIVAHGDDQLAVLRRKRLIRDQIGVPVAHPGGHLARHHPVHRLVR